MEEADRVLPELLKCPINILPPEILADIFEIATRWTEIERELTVSHLAKEVQDCEPRSTPEGLQEDCSDYDDMRIIPIQVSISHVCSHWRRIALDTPKLWTRVNVRVFSISDPQLPEEWIRRSKSLPLDIMLDEFFAKDAKSLPAMDRIIPPLLRHVNRWRTFMADVRTLSRMRHLLEALFAEGLNAPLLEHLKLIFYKKNSIPSIWPRTLVYGAQLPNLRSVTLENVPIDYSTLVPSRDITEISTISTPLAHTSNLTKFELTNQMIAIRPDFSTFIHILRCSPNLETLILSNSGPQMPVPGTLVKPLSLPMLHKLQLGRIPISLALLFLRILHFTPKTLDLEFLEARDYTNLLHVLVQPVKERAPLDVYASVTQLTAEVSNPPLISRIGMGKYHSKKLGMLEKVYFCALRGMPLVGFKCARAFYMAAPWVSFLHLNMHYMDGWFFDMLSLTWQGKPIPEMGCHFYENPGDVKDPSKPPSLENANLSKAYAFRRRAQIFINPAPMLFCLRVSNVPGFKLKHLVETRRRVGLWLHSLRIDVRDKYRIVSREEIKWLRQNVYSVVFRRFHDEGNVGFYGNWWEDEREDVNWEDDEEGEEDDDDGGAGEGDEEDGNDDDEWDGEDDDEEGDGNGDYSDENEENVTDSEVEDEEEE